MGILNVTPDSFSDGGRHERLDDARRHAERLLQEGAAIIDVGGESTRPGAEPVALEAERERVLSVVEMLVSEFDALVSVDTSAPELMREVAEAGAGMINDVRSLTRPGALEAAADTGLPVCLMHMLGEPQTMQQAPHYDRPVEAAVGDFLRDMSQWFREGKLKHKEFVTEGLDSAPGAFMGLLKGANFGKQLVRVGPDKG